MKTTYIILVFLAVISCKKNTSSGVKNSETIEEIEIVKNDHSTSENYKKLQGTWVNIDAPLSRLTFEGDKVINTYNGANTEKNITFSMGKTCSRKAIKNASEEDRYINTTGDSEECYYIVKLEEDSMILGFWGTETPLRFKRQ
ncbi:hypothetical protein [Patiriisocius sp. Uisw_017]|jgi:hypothetical protein|uniref:hypothetical protein n=1 Tax=Patiriisocius sp. Uisw_017 TaxID=3230968 RepID=UPI0039EB5575